MPELIRDGIDGLLVLPADPEALADALEKLMDDPARGPAWPLPHAVASSNSTTSSAIPPAWETPFFGI